MIDYPSEIQTIAVAGNGENEVLGLSVEFSITLNRARVTDVLTTAMQGEYVCNGTIDTEAAVALLENDQFLLLARCAAPPTGRDLAKRNFCPRCNPLLIYRTDQRSFGTAETEGGPVEMMGTISMAFVSPFATGAALNEGTMPFSIEGVTELRPRLFYLSQGEDGRENADVLIVWGGGFDTYSCSATLEFRGIDYRLWEITCRPWQGYGPYSAPEIALKSRWDGKMWRDNKDGPGEKWDASEIDRLFVASALPFGGFRSPVFGATGPGSRIIFIGDYGRRKITDPPQVRIKSFSGTAGHRVLHDPDAPYDYRDKATAGVGATADLFGSVSPFPDIGKPFVAENGCLLARPGEHSNTWSADGITNTIFFAWG